MAKKLLVRTPKTVDGRNLAYNEEKQPIYIESIAELSAKRDFESLNAKLPKALQHQLKEIDVAEESGIKKILNEKDNEIAELRKLLAAKGKEGEDVKKGKDADKIAAKGKEGEDVKDQGAKNPPAEK